MERTSPSPRPPPFASQSGSAEVVEEEVEVESALAAALNQSRLGDEEPRKAAEKVPETELDYPAEDEEAAAVAALQASSSSVLTPPPHSSRPSTGERERSGSSTGRPRGVRSSRTNLTRRAEEYSMLNRAILMSLQESISSDGVPSTSGPSG